LSFDDDDANLYESYDLARPKKKKAKQKNKKEKEMILSPKKLRIERRKKEE
jgi:hypothetical protein